MTQSTLSYRRQSNIFQILPQHSLSINSNASFLSISITFIYFLSLVSPIICILCWFILTVTTKCTPSITLIRQNSRLFPLSLLSMCDTLDLFLLGSVNMKGQFDKFLITYFCFRQLSLNFQVSQLDFFSWSLLSSLAFSTSIFCNCLRLKSLFKLLFILAWLSLFLLFLPIIDDNLYNSIRFSRQISVNLVYFNISRLRLLMCIQVGGSRVPVLGRMWVRLLRWNSLDRYSSRFLMLRFRYGVPRYILKSQVIILLICATCCYPHYNRLFNCMKWWQLAQQAKIIFTGDHFLLLCYFLMPLLLSIGFTEDELSSEEELSSDDESDSTSLFFLLLCVLMLSFLIELLYAWFHH